MPPITAHLVAGDPDPAGGFQPTHWACLVEGPRPHWHLGPAGHSSKAPLFTTRWYTSPASVVADAMVMVGIAIERRPWLPLLVPGARGRLDGGFVDLPRIPTSSRVRVDQLNQATAHTVHLMITVLAGSMLYRVMHNFPRYPVSLDICTAHYSQEGALARSRWRGRARPAPPGSPQHN